jgi:FkbM family methyltransferase
MSMNGVVIFRAVKWLGRKRVKGTDLLYSVCRPIWQKEVVTYTLSPTVSLEVPIGTKEHGWDLRDVIDYESDLIDVFCSALDTMEAVTFFDCGADIGLFSAKLCSRCDRISRILAFEPNPAIQKFFCHNIEHLPGGEAYALALGSTAGFGNLERPAYATWSDHARYIVPSEDGMRVVTLDSFEVFGARVAIKVDVEGGELDVLKGASETIRRASRCVVSLEAHPLVQQRTGISSAAGMSFLESIRPFDFIVAETRQRVKASDNFIDPARVFNILAVSAD